MDRKRINELRQEAGQAGDMEMVGLCDACLCCSAEARLDDGGWLVSYVVDDTEHTVGLRPGLELDADALPVEVVEAIEATLRWEGCNG